MQNDESSFEIASEQDILWLRSHMNAHLKRISVGFVNGARNKERVDSIEVILNKHWHSCGCETGALFLIAYLPLLVIYTLCYCPFRLLSITYGLLAIGGFISFAVSGKLVGIAYSQLQCRRALDSLLDLFKLANTARE